LRTQWTRRLDDLTAATGCHALIKMENQSAFYHRLGWKPKACHIVKTHPNGTVDVAAEPGGEPFVTGAAVVQQATDADDGVVSLTAAQLSSQALLEEAAAAEAAKKKAEEQAAAAAEAAKKKAEEEEAAKKAKK